MAQRLRRAFNQEHATYDWQKVKVYLFVLLHARGDKRLVANRNKVDDGRVFGLDCRQKAVCVRDGAVDGLQEIKQMDAAALCCAANNPAIWRKLERCDVPDGVGAQRRDGSQPLAFGQVPEVQIIDVIYANRLALACIPAETRNRPLIEKHREETPRAWPENKRTVFPVSRSQTRQDLSEDPVAR